MYYEAQVQEKARQIARIISDERLEELALDKVEGVPTYDGTFKTIYNMVKEYIQYIKSECDDLPDEAINEMKNKWIYKPYKGK